jgi:hypothetical protein
MRVSKQEQEASVEPQMPGLSSRFTHGLVFMLSLHVLVVLFLGAQLVFIGGLDRLGLSPQSTFVIFNVAVLLLVVGPGLASPFRIVRWAMSRFSGHMDGSIASVQTRLLPCNTGGRLEPICKTLIIRRLHTAVAQTTPHTDKEGRQRNALVVQDWFSGS